MSSKPITILFVDDDEIVLNSMRNFLASEPDLSVQAGYQVLFYTSPVKALQELEQHNIGLVVSDYRMPGMDGLSFLAKVKDRYPQVPCILLTGHANKENTIKAINEVGLYRYIEKPWNNNQVATIIRSGLQRMHFLKMVKGKTQPLATILVVDDDEMTVTALGNLLRLRTDYQPLFFTSPLEAVRELGQRSIDLVIADYLMPGMDGLSFLAKVKDRYPQVPCILLTGYADKENAIKAINEVGLYYYIEKPWDNESLLLIIRNALDKAALLRMVEEKTWALERLADLIVTKAKETIRLFLCYAREDSDRVLEIYTRLKEMGFAPWLDKKDLLPGQRWDEEIRKVIRASNFVLIFLSKTSVAKQGYVQKEFRYALDVLDEMPEGKRFIIPVRLDECEIPNRLSALQCVDLFHGFGLETIVKSVLPD